MVNHSTGGVRPAGNILQTMPRQLVQHGATCQHNQQWGALIYATSNIASMMSCLTLDREAVSGFLING